MAGKVLPWLSFRADDSYALRTGRGIERVRPPVRMFSHQYLVVILVHFEADGLQHVVSHGFSTWVGHDRLPIPLNCFRIVAGFGRESGQRCGENEAQVKHMFHIDAILTRQRFMHSGDRHPTLAHGRGAALY